MKYVRTIKIAMDQGAAIRGVVVYIKGTHVVGVVSHATEVGVYLNNDDHPYDPESLVIGG